MDSLPDFLIIGTMKGGTTVLHDFINEHELVVPAEKKEIHYFSLYSDEEVEWYKKHFPKIEGKLVGDASPSYFDMANSIAIPKNIKKLLPGVKLILIVRNPVERAISHFSHLCRVNKIPILANMDVNEFFGRSFLDALRQTSTIDYYLSLVLSFSTYSRKYKNYLNVFDKEQLLVIKNEDLLRDPQNVMKRVFEFLELSPIKSKSFEQFKYSTGPSKKNLSEVNVRRLEEYLYPDYEVFCEDSGLNFLPVTTPEAGHPDVMEGLNGWLFLAGGVNNPLDYYTGRKVFGDSLVKSWHRLLRNRYTRLEKKGIEYLHLFVPNKLTLYPELSTIALSHFDGSPIRVFMSSIHNSDDSPYLKSILNSTPYLSKQKMKHKLFYKTDTHWNAFGCFSAYQLVCSKLGAKPNVDLLTRSFSEGPCIFDLGGKMTPPRKEKIRTFKFLEDSIRVYANYLVAYKENNGLENDGGLHVGSNVIFKNDKAENRKTVVLFGDSFSEYRTSLLTGMLAETFSELHFVWSASIDYEYIDANKPDIVITQIVERFMPVVPADRFSLNEYVKQKVSELRSR
jgi:alginate O-acetyltransferase complex protein AlgJ